MCNGEAENEMTNGSGYTYCAYRAKGSNVAKGFTSNLGKPFLLSPYKTVASGAVNAISHCSLQNEFNMFTEAENQHVDAALRQDLAIDCSFNNPVEVHNEAMRHRRSHNSYQQIPSNGFWDSFSLTPPSRIHDNVFDSKNKMCFPDGLKLSPDDYDQFGWNGYSHSDSLQNEYNMFTKTENQHVDAASRQDLAIQYSFKHPVEVHNEAMRHRRFHNSYQQMPSNGFWDSFSSTPPSRIHDNVLDFKNKMCWPNGLKLSPDDYDQSDWNGYSHNDSLSGFQSRGYFEVSLRQIFEPHYSIESINDAIQKGKIFKAKFRVNMHNRTEGYCTLDGVPIDILIAGQNAQNRAIEGDLVAISLDPVSSWPELKGSTSKQYVDNVEGRDDLLLQNSSSEGEDSESDMDPCVSSMDDSQFYFPECKEQDEMSIALSNVILNVKSHTKRRPTGRVVGILEKSQRREAVIGFLEVRKWLQQMRNKQGAHKERKNMAFNLWGGYIKLAPTDTKFPKMIVMANSLPEEIKSRLRENDQTIESELFVASIVMWKEDSFLPQAIIKHCLGRGREIEVQTEAILYQHAVRAEDFSSEALKQLPKSPWSIPYQELKSRRDIRSLRVFSIDPPTARDLDDALSVENIGYGITRVGVHVADVSYFVKPNTELDHEARDRSTSFYLIQKMFSMLPRVLCDEFCSLNPGVERLAFSVMWDIHSSGEILDHWIGRTVVQSCCKLSYQQAQDIIDGTLESNRNTEKEASNWPPLYGMFEWKGLVEDIRTLHNIARQRRETRFNKGALKLDNSKLVFILDDDVMPCDSMIDENKDSNILVEEFMLLANITVAEVITRAFPQCSLLRRHPEPNPRKMKEFEAFSKKRGFNIDVSSAGALQHSLERLKDKLKDDPDLFDIVVMFATKPMQLATYFCSGEFVDDEAQWAHYALATPLYTHFTSPLRRYPDIVVHRILAATLEADDICQKMLNSKRRCFAGIVFDKELANSSAGKKALLTARLKHKVPSTADLALIAAHCNERKFSSKCVQEASNKVYLWALLKKKNLITHARVLAVGPKFMSVYIPKLAMEERIYFDGVEEFIIQWSKATETLVLDMKTSRSSSEEKCKVGKGRLLKDVAVIVNTANSIVSSGNEESSYESVMFEIEKNMKRDLLASKEEGSCLRTVTTNETLRPAPLPLTLQLLSTVPVSVHATGGEKNCPDVSVSLFLSHTI